MTPEETFKDAMLIALKAAKQTGKRYFILWPDIANPGLGDLCHLLVPLVHESEMSNTNHHERVDEDEIALTIFPSGEIRFGMQAKCGD